MLKCILTSEKDGNFGSHFSQHCAANDRSLSAVSTLAGGDQDVEDVSNVGQEVWKGIK